MPRNRQIADEEAMFLAKPHLTVGHALMGGENMIHRRCFREDPHKYGQTYRVMPPISWLIIPMNYIDITSIKPRTIGLIGLICTKLALKKTGAPPTIWYVSMDPDPGISDSSNRNGVERYELVGGFLPPL